jgi:hypothetical protein
LLNPICGAYTLIPAPVSRERNDIYLHSNFCASLDDSSPFTLCIFTFVCDTERLLEQLFGGHQTKELNNSTSRPHIIRFKIVILAQSHEQASQMPPLILAD